MKLTLLCNCERLMVIPCVLLLLGMDNSLHCFLLDSAEVVVKIMNFSFGDVIGFVDHLLKAVYQFGNCDPGGIVTVEVLRYCDHVK